MQNLKHCVNADWLINNGLLFLMKNTVEEARIDLAAAYRLADMHGLSEGICNHLTLVVPGYSDRYLIIAYGTHWSQARASDLLIVDISGNIIEGKGVFLKKIGRIVKPANGFNVIATANTKGKGSEDGRFIGTNVLNEAFLERFALTFEQEYPSAKVEQNILGKLCRDKNFCARLADWADIIRKTFYDGGIDEVISTRRLVHIVNAYSIFNDKVKAIQLCLNRFDDETKQAFLDLYDKVDADVDIQQEG